MADNKEKADIKEGKEKIPKNEDIYKEYFNCAFVLYGNVRYLEDIKKYIIKNFVNTGLLKLIKPTYAKEGLLIVDKSEYMAYNRFKKEINKKNFDKSDKFNFAFILRGEVKDIETIRDYIAKQYLVKVIIVNYDKEKLYIVDKSQWEHFKRSTKHGGRP
jgi:hypothetical protein